MAAKNESKVLSKKNEFINLTEYLQLVENEPIPCEEIDEYKKIQRTIIKRSNVSLLNLQILNFVN